MNSHIASQILTHTPIFVWAILAFLLYRGLAASVQREMPFRRLCIIPAVMLVLSLQGIVHTFGGADLAMASWALGCAVTAALLLQFGAPRVWPGSAPGRVVVRGSWAPLALMMAIFFTKYSTAVLVAMQPQLAQQAGFALAVCLLFGIFNGYFIGRLLRDAIAMRAFAPQFAAAG